MNRKVWDQLVSTAGVVLAVALIVLGGLAIYGGNFGQQNVRDRLEPQKVFFAPYDAMTPTEQQEVGDFAGQQVVNGTHVVEVLSCHQTVPAPGTRLGSRCWRKFRRHRNCFASRCSEELVESTPLDLLPPTDVPERRHRMSSLRSAHFPPTSAATASRHTPIPASCARFKLATFPLKSARRPNTRATSTSMRASILPPRARAIILPTPSSEVSPGPPPMIRTTSRLPPGTL